MDPLYGDEWGTRPKWSEGPPPVGHLRDRVSPAPLVNHRRWHLHVGCCSPVSLPLLRLRVGYTPAPAGGGGRSPRLRRPVRGL